MQLGVVGLGTMGANLARNAASRGARVAVYNRTAERTDEFMTAHVREGDFVACRSYKHLRDALQMPRAILIMVKAGDAVDGVINELLPLLSPGDILIDGGNSRFQDTERREKELKSRGINFFGMGVSGGEEGALKGPSMMPGGDERAYRTMEPLLRSMSADDGAGGKCVTHIGPGGAGHFVKMVHNGIEYGAMQLIAETYAVMQHAGKMSNEDLGRVYADWSVDSAIGGFLLEITAKIFRTKDGDTGKDVLDLIVDRAGQKGTGKWTTEAAMDLGVPIPTINASVDARILSGAAGLRASVAAEGIAAPLSADMDPADLATACRGALELSLICSYVQGFDLIATASREYNWNVNVSEVARIWRGGCIIRSALLPAFQQAFDPATEFAAKHVIFGRFAGEAQEQWRSVVAVAVSAGIAVPAMASALAYYDALRTPRLPQNLLQAQRDFFGAHTYERTDKPGTFHTHWQ